MARGVIGMGSTPSTPAKNRCGKAWKGVEIETLRCNPKTTTSTPPHHTRIGVWGVVWCGGWGAATMARCGWRLGVGVVWSVVRTGVASLVAMGRAA
jgi:hypothetical protein